jgi:hypothetical protein
MRDPGYSLRMEKEHNMLAHRLSAGALALFLVLFTAISSQAGWQDFLQELTGSGTDNGEIALGLKEALSLGCDQAVAALGKEGGFSANPELRIPLPESIARLEKPLRYVGLGGQLDALEQSMNRAAEQAVPLARPLLRNALEQMTFADARAILAGPDDAATRYFEKKTRPRLQETFRPVVHDSLADTGVVRLYENLEQRMQKLPFSQALQFDLDGYVTQAALEGLFTLLAEQERLIREDPAARTTELLRKVFQ